MDMPIFSDTFEYDINTISLEEIIPLDFESQQEETISKPEENADKDLSGFPHAPPSLVIPSVSSFEKNSDQIPVNISYPSLSPYATKCSQCCYWKKHGKFVTDTHMTCLCFLFQCKAICCVRGYTNLLSSIPSLAPITPIPDKTIDQWHGGIKKGRLAIPMRDFEQMIQVCNESRQDALSVYFKRMSNTLPQIIT